MIELIRIIHDTWQRRLTAEEVLMIARREGMA